MRIFFGGRSLRILAGCVLLCCSAVPVTAASAAGATLPGWIKPGLVEEYYDYIDNGYITVDTTTHVTGVSNGVVHATTVLRTFGLPGSKSYPWTCTAAGFCPGGAAGWQFWIDPHDPVGSVSGQGVSFVYLGTHVEVDPWHRSWTVGILYYKNPVNNVTYTIFFRPSTGLVLMHYEHAGQIVTFLWWHTRKASGGS